jgi:hypothetical protein
MEMLEFDVEAFVAKMDRMGLKLTAVPLADGRYRLNRWRTMDAVANSQHINDLWASQIGTDLGRIDQLTAHLAQAARKSKPVDKPVDIPPAQLTAAKPRPAAVHFAQAAAAKPEAAVTQFSRFTAKQVADAARQSAATPSVARSDFRRAWIP